jgi:hypothetical protein
MLLLRLKEHTTTVRILCLTSSAKDFRLSHYLFLSWSVFYPVSLFVSLVAYIRNLVHPVLETPFLYWNCVDVWRCILVEDSIQYESSELIPWAARCMACVCNRWLAWIAVSKPGGVMDVSSEYCMSSGRGLFVGLIIRLEECCRIWCV